MDGFYARRFTKDPVLFVTQEFGTKPGVLVRLACYMTLGCLARGVD